MNRLYTLAFLLIPLTLIIWFWVSKSTSNSGHPDWPTRRELLRRERGGPKPVLVYGTGNPAVTSRYKQMVDTIDADTPWFDFEIKADTEVNWDTLTKRRVYLVGTPHSNKLLQKVLPHTPFKFEAGRFFIHDDVFPHAEDRLHFLYPNPYNPKIPVYVITGNTDEAILQGKTIEVRGDFQVFHGNKASLFGMFSQTPATRWEIDPALIRHLYFEEKPTLETTHYQFFGAQDQRDPEPFKALSEERETAYQQIEAFTGPIKPHPKFRYYLYKTFEDKGLATNEVNCTTHGFVRPERMGRTPVEDHRISFEVFSVSDDFLICNNGLIDGRQLIRHQLGQPKTLALELGLAMYFSKNWHRYGYAYWSARLAQSGYLPTISELVNNEVLLTDSDLIYPPATGVLVAFLLKEWGREAFLSRYIDWRPTPAEERALAPRFLAFVQQQNPEFDRITQTIKSQYEKPRPFLQGFNFGHEGYGIYNGYISRQATESIAALRQIGSNSIAVIPYSFMRDPKKPTSFRFSRSADEENDEAVITVASHARELGMSVLLKPQVWIPRSWPGEVEMQSEADWDAFFEHYEHWIRHYALLAEMYQIPALCVATEFGKATKGHEHRWIALFRQLRSLYSGKMTVAANWDGGFDHKPFWDELDFIGINNYKTLSQKSDPSDAELLAGARAENPFFQNISERFGKKIVFTEVGFTATDTPWIRPWEYADGKKVNLEHQRRSYQALLTALHKQPWLGGYFWWKWPSFLDYGGPNDPDFTPNGKPAEDVVKEWFEKRAD
ncbi:MAG TPA: hypothetical protein PLO56_02720 [Rhodothermales bacterium]|nr:hypothetical protein [Rhodothermales bacterium]